MRSTQIIFALTTMLLALLVIVQGLSMGAQPPLPIDAINDEISPAPVSIVDDGGNDAQSVIEYRVVGFTTATNGDIRTTDAKGAELRGYKAMHRLCEVEVAPNARAAFSTEYLRSPPLVGLTKSWLVPKKPTRLFRPNGLGFWVAYDAAVGGIATPPYTNPQTTRATAINALSCSGFTNSTAALTGAVAEQGVVTPTPLHSDFPASVTLASCNAEFPVACAAPVAIPATLLVRRN